MTWGGFLLLIFYITTSFSSLQFSGAWSSVKWKDFPIERAQKEDNNVAKRLAEFTLEEISTGQGALFGKDKKGKEENDKSYGWRSRRSVKYAADKVGVDGARRRLLLRRLQRKWQQQREMFQRRYLHQQQSPVQKAVQDIQRPPIMPNRQQQQQEKNERHPATRTPEADSRGVYDKWRLINQRRRERKTFSQRQQSSRSERILPLRLSGPLTQEKANKDSTTESSQRYEMSEEVAKMSSLRLSVTTRPTQSKSLPNSEEKSNREPSVSQRNHHSPLSKFVAESTSIKPFIKPFSEREHYKSEPSLPLEPLGLLVLEKANEKSTTDLSHQKETPKEVRKLSKPRLSVTPRPTQSKRWPNFKNSEEKNNGKSSVSQRNHHPPISRFVTESTTIKPFIKSTTALDYLSSYDSRTTPKRWPLKIVLPDHDRISLSMKAESNQRAVLPKHGSLSAKSFTENQGRGELLPTPSAKSWDTVMKAELEEDNGEVKESVESLEGSGAHSGEVDEDETKTTETKLSNSESENETSSIAKTEKVELTTTESVTKESDKQIKARKRRKRLQERMWRRYERMRKRRLRKKKRQRWRESQDTCKSQGCMTTAKTVDVNEKVTKTTKISEIITASIAESAFIHHNPKLKISLSPTASISVQHPGLNDETREGDKLEGILLKTNPPLVISATPEIRERGKITGPNNPSAVESVSRKSNNEFSTSNQFHKTNTTPSKPVMNYMRPEALWKDENARNETQFSNKQAGDDKITFDSGVETTPGFSASVADVVTTNDKENDDKAPFYTSSSPNSGGEKSHFVENIDVKPKQPTKTKNNSQGEDDTLRNTTRHATLSKVSPSDDPTLKKGGKESLVTPTTSNSFSARIRPTATTSPTAMTTSIQDRQKPRPSVSTSARRWADYIRKRRRKQKNKSKKRKKTKKDKTDSRGGSMSASWSSHIELPPQVPSKVEKEEPKAGSDDNGPFIGYKTAYDFLSSQKGSVGIAHSESRRESNEMNRFMSEGMCEIFNKHYVPTRIGGKCV